VCEDWQLTRTRFVSLPASTLRSKLEAQLRQSESDADKLTKRLVYLETTHKNSMEHIERMLKGAN
jgi:hypothetical protein